MFADDLVLLDDTEKGLQELFNWLEEFCSNWNLLYWKTKIDIL